jgi:hypothetical protein
VPRNTLVRLREGGTGLLVGEENQLSFGCHRRRRFRLLPRIPLSELSNQLYEARWQWLGDDLVVKLMQRFAELRQVHDIFSRHGAWPTHQPGRWAGTSVGGL